MWNANSQGGLFAYSLRNQRAHSRRTLGAVTTDIPLSRQRSRSGRQLRNQPGCSLSRRRSTNSRGSANAWSYSQIDRDNGNGNVCEKDASRKHPVEFRTGSHHLEWVREFRRRSRKLWIVVCVSASRTIPERRYRFLGNYRHLVCLTLPAVASSLCKHQVSTDHARIQMSGFTIFHIFEKKEKETEIERIIKWHSIRKNKFYSICN